MPSCLKELYSDFEPESPPRKPSLSRLIDLFVKCAKEYPQVFVLLDAFDECSLNLRQDVIKIVTQFHVEKIKVWVTTQHGRLSALTTGPLNGAITVEIKADDGDVERYVRANLSDSDIDDELTTEIVKKIVSGVNGMYVLVLCYLLRFLLAKVRVDWILTEIDGGHIREALDELPNTASDSYIKSIRHIENRKFKGTKIDAMYALSWIFNAQRSLQMKELLVAIAVTKNTTTDGDYENDKRLQPVDITEMCHGLVFYDKTSGIVEFIHGTVKPFLKEVFDPDETEDTSPLEQNFIDAPKLKGYFLRDVHLAQACLEYLSLDIFDKPCPESLESMEKRVQKYKFSRYAAQFWGLHTRGEAEKYPCIQQAVLSLLASENKDSMLQLEAYASSSGGRMSFAKGQTLLHVIAQNGLATICKWVLDGRINGNDTYALEVDI